MSCPSAEHSLRLRRRRVVVLISPVYTVLIQINSKCINLQGPGFKTDLRAAYYLSRGDATYVFSYPGTRGYSSYKNTLLYYSWRGVNILITWNKHDHMHTLLTLRQRLQLRALM